MSTEWYYADDGNVAGPLSLDEVVTRIKKAIIRPHLVWTTGMQEWKDARCVGAFAHLFEGAPPPEQIAEVSAPQGATQPAEGIIADAVSSAADKAAIRQQNVHAWRRYFARMFDIYAFSIFASFVLGIFVPELFSGRPEVRVDENVLGLAYLVVYIPVEAFALYAFGTSPGKALYGIKINPTIDTEIRFGKALKRSVLVWFRGLGLGIPIISLFTLTAGYSSLKKEGSTTWDRDIHWSISHSKIGVLRWLAILACWAGGVFVIAVGLSLKSG